LLIIVLNEGEESNIRIWSKKLRFLFFHKKIFFILEEELDYYFFF